MGIVYLTTNKINNKKYIGVDTANNKYYYGSGIAIKNALKKYGVENFIKEILFESDNNELLFEKEKFLIEKYNAVESKEFYNIAEGGKGGAGTLTSTESKIKHKIGCLKNGKIMTEKRKDKTYEEIYGDKADEEKEKRRQAGLGKKYSEERRINISNSLKDNIPWNKGKKGVQVSWLKNKTDVVFKSYILEINNIQKIFNGRKELSNHIKEINKNKKKGNKINISLLINNKKEKGYNLKIISFKDL